MHVFNGRIVHHRSKDLMTWRTLIGEAFGEPPIADEAVMVEMTFVLAQPKTVKRLYPHVRPDVDKLVRAVLDALTGRAYVDDAQVVWVHAEKIYGSHPGAWIRVAPRYGD